LGIAAAAEAAGGKVLLEAIGCHGEITAALESSLSVEEADRMLSELAVRGHLDVSLEYGRLVYAVMGGVRRSPIRGWRSGGTQSLWCGRRLNLRLGTGEMDNTPNQAGGYEDRQPLSAEDVAQFFRRPLWAIFLAPLAMAGTALAFSLLQTPTYEASATVLVGQRQGQGDSPARIEELQALIPSAVEIITRRPVAEEASSGLDLAMDPEAVLENLSAQQTIESGQLIEVSYTDTDARRSERGVNAVGEVASERISRLPMSAHDIKATVVEAATVPRTPEEPDPLRNAILAAALGTMFGCGLAFVREVVYKDNVNCGRGTDTAYVDRRDRVNEDCENVFGGQQPNPVVEKVSGKGELGGAYGNPRLRVEAESAGTNPDDAQGRFSITYPGDPNVAHDNTYVRGSILCLAVSHKEARLVGRINSASGPRAEKGTFEKGEYVRIGVLDAGEDDKANFSAGEQRFTPCNGETPNLDVVEGKGFVVKEDV
jgi:capsular polysaccharide biosynthesis protein